MDYLSAPGLCEMSLLKGPIFYTVFSFTLLQFFFHGAFKLHSQTATKQGLPRQIDERPQLPSADEGCEMVFYEEI